MEQASGQGGVAVAPGGVPASGTALATSFQPASAIHMTHMANFSGPSGPYESCAIQFQLPNAIIWQIKFLLAGVQSKKTAATASADFAALGETFGRDFDKYLLKELIEQLDFRDASTGQAKASGSHSKDKTESAGKLTLLTQELTRASQKPEFLSYFSEIMHAVSGDSAKNRHSEFLQELTRRLKLNAQMQILVSLSLLESALSDDEAAFDEALRLFRQKLVEFHQNGKPEMLPEYAVHRILYLFSEIPDLAFDPHLQEARQLIVDTIANRYGQCTPLRASLHQDISQVNCHPELPSFAFLRDGGGLEHLEIVQDVLQPWEVLLDIGHSSSHMYDFLLKVLADFRDIDEKTMALTLLHLAINHAGREDKMSRIVYGMFEANKDGNSAPIKKEPDDKQASLSWAVDNLARAFRELYPALSWQRVFDAFGELERSDLPANIVEEGLDARQFGTLLQLFNKSKPQNLPFPLQALMTQQWNCPELQLTFIQNCMTVAISKKDKSVQFAKLKNRAPPIPDLQDMKDRGENASIDYIDIWQSVDVVERLVLLSEHRGLFIPVRRTFAHAVKHLPEYLLLTLSQAKPYTGNVMLDELLSTLVPIFLGDHVNSSVVLQQLFKLNEALFIRVICEESKHDQKLMNLSRVLDITQEVRASLIPIVYCEDYKFAVSLGILAGKRDFLHYDMWIKSRFKDVGSPFIDALLKWIEDNVVAPVQDFNRRNASLAESNSDAYETQKTAILERSHLSKEKLMLTFEHLTGSTLMSNDKVTKETLQHINELANVVNGLFPQHNDAGGSSDEIDAVANEHFQRVFSADDSEVDARIEELIETMQNFKESQDVKEQEVYACMLHGLFDEYRFLHRYPQQYLTKIAKLFGAIIKNKLLDRVLQDIALKFVIEAFRRDGRRQKFGIIVIKSFFDKLPRFPKFLEDIYQIRTSIQHTEPQMMYEIERLYNETKAGAAAGAAGFEGTSTGQDTGDDSKLQAISDAAKLEDNLSANTNTSDGSKASKQPQEKTGSKDKKAAGQSQQRGANLAAPAAAQAAGKQGGAKNQRGQNQGQTDAAMRTSPQNDFSRGGTSAAAAGTSGQQMASSGRTFIPYQGKMGAGAIPFQPNQNMSDQSMTGVIGGGGGQPTFTPNREFYNSTGSQGMSSNLPANNTSGGLNIAAAEFQRPLSSSNMNMMGQSSSPFEPPKNQEINIHSREFQPSRSTQDHLGVPPSLSPHQAPGRQQHQVTEKQFRELLTIQEKINERIKKAQDANAKVRLDDVLEDESIAVDSDTVEDIRCICNNTGKQNLRQKLEELKKFVVAKRIEGPADETMEQKSARAEDNLRWLLHYILSKRLSSQSFPLQQIYAEIIRELNQSVPLIASKVPGRPGSTVMGLTLAQTALIFKKCMVIDEDEFMKVTNIAQGSTSVIKSYLQSLGTFVGSLTLAKNEPIRAMHLDLKQILIEGSQVKNSRFAVAFVCRILKESAKSRYFTPRNPWINSLLGILREIYDLTQMIQGPSPMSGSHHDNEMEINALFVQLQLAGTAEIQPYGILQSIINPGVFLEASQRRELDYFLRKTRVVIPASASVDNVEAKKFGELGQDAASFADRTSREAQERREQQMTQISQAVRVTDDLVEILQRFYNFNEQRIRNLVGKAVDDSIVEILPPVVDRSVTIALITTRELVLKDFAYDRDYNRVLEASDLIVQNLAGSLALVTCREPLRMSLTTNIKKSFDQHFRQELGLEVKPAGTAPIPIAKDKSAEKLKYITEEQISEITVLACRENLELGCMLIKKEVIDKALKKVREDLQIIQAVEKRKRAEELGIKLFKDDNVEAQFHELPPQLRPNQNGLTAAQFQVYADFAKLNQVRSGEMGFGDLTTPGMGMPFSPEMPLAGQMTGFDNTMTQQKPQTLAQLLTMVDQYGLTDANRDYLLSKIEQLNLTAAHEAKEDKEKLWAYLQRNLETVCKNFGRPGVDSMVEVLSLIVEAYRQEDFSKRLLIDVFVRFDVAIFNDVELNILLMSKRIISVSEWDSQLSHFFKESAAQLPPSELKFFSRFLEASIVEKKLLTKEDLPLMIEAIEQSATDPTIGNFCQYILEMLNFKSASPSPILALGGQPQDSSQHQSLRQFFIKWVVMSYVEDKENQERQINTLFQDLEGMGIMTEPRSLFVFCKVMVHTSIEKALLYGDTGEQRPPDRLDYRYIDSFVKLIVVLLRKFSFNKHEFMTKVFEFIGEVLDEDHKAKKAQFNQRPYYRMLVNILTAVNHSGCFNNKTQLLILYSMADLFRSLVPQLYPGFCFAWLELISHKWFLPHFLKSSGPGEQHGPGNGAHFSQQQLAQVQQAAQQSFSGSLDSTFYQRRFKIKDLMVNAFTFLKNNMVPNTPTPPSLQAFYHACLRVVTVVRRDFPDFLCDFHFNFVNCLPEQCIQLRNLILAAYPSNIQQPDPFSKNLKIDLLTEIEQVPRILSNYDNYLSLMGLREDLEIYTRTRDQSLIGEICRKMEQSEEIVNGRRRMNSNVIGAVVLFIANWKAGHTKQPQDVETQRDEQRETRETFKAIVRTLGDEARLCFLNAIVNELRYPNIHTFYFSCIILFIYVEAEKDIVHEQMSAIFLERLQTEGPYPWGLMITFRELIQIPKFQFMKRNYIKNNFQAVAKLFQGQLRNYLDFVPTPLRYQILQDQQQEEGAAGLTGTKQAPM